MGQNMPGRKTCKYVPESAPEALKHFLTIFCYSETFDTSALSYRGGGRVAAALSFSHAALMGGGRGSDQATCRSPSSAAGAASQPLRAVGATILLPGVASSQNSSLPPPRPIEAKADISPPPRPPSRQLSDVRGLKTVVSSPVVVVGLVGLINPPAAQPAK